MNIVFKTLFSTLHMSGGYLRFNGSFIKRLPLLNELPEFLSLLGRILQFLSQLKYEIDFNLKNKYSVFEDKINLYLEFFTRITDSLVYLLFLRNKHKTEFDSLKKVLISKREQYPIKTEEIDSICFLSNLEENQKIEIENILDDIGNLYKILTSKKALVKEIADILILI